MNDTENSMTELTIWRNSLIWTCLYLPEGGVEDSKEFYSGRNKDCTWKLSTFYNMGQKNLYLTLIRCKYFKIKAVCNLRINSNEYNMVLDFCVGDEKLLRDIDVPRDTQIVCKIKIENEKEYILKEKECQSKICKDFESLLYNNNFNDVQLHVAETTLHANKAILAACSPYFKAMFNKDMEENRTGIVKLDDTDPKIIEDILHFIYTNQINRLKENTKELFLAAKKYALNDLKIICESALYQNLTIDNAIDLLKFCDSNNAYDLKNETLDFIKVNIKDIRTLKDFAWLKESHKDIAIDILKAVINNR